MQSFTILLAALPAVMAYPGMSGAVGDMESHLKQQRAAEVEERGLVGGLLSALGSDIQGLLGAVASEVDQANKRPEPGYEFIAPGPNDSRGPCPGLNLLANYGYLPRNGNVSYGQVLDATARGFNMHPDLATVLSVFAVLADGDLVTESWWLGASPAGTGNIGGLNRHDTVEADISPNREDFYNGCGDNHHLSSRMFKQNVEIAAKGSKLFDFDTMTAQYAANAAFSQKNNPYLYYFPFPTIVSLGAFVFYSTFFSNGTYGAGGVPNYESISSIIGAQYNSDTDAFEYVPERWPENWYRRATPWGAVETVLTGFGVIYPADPVPMPIPQLGTPNFNATTVLCDVVAGIGSITPLILDGTTEEIESALAWAAGKFADVGLTDTILGCPKSALSNEYLYPNKTGGPFSPPPAVVSNEANNVYYKTYFTDAPTTPQCNHVS